MTCRRWPWAVGTWRCRPSGSELAVTYNPDSTAATSTNNDVFVMAPDGSGRQSITTNRANDHSPAYSPDSRYIAYLAAEIPGFESDRQALVLYERATGRRMPLTASWMRASSPLPGRPTAARSSRKWRSGGSGCSMPIEIPTGRTTRLVAGGVNTAVRIAPGGDFFVFLHQSATTPAELYRSDASGRSLRQLTRLNTPLTARLSLTPLEPFGFLARPGTPCSAGLLKPPGFEAGRHIRWSI